MFLQHLELLVSHSESCLLVELSLIADVVRDVVDLISSCLNGRVKSHGVLSSMLQVLFEIGNLSGKSSLG